MGLKLQEVSDHHAKGLLDGMPFSLKVLRNSAEVFIGDARNWRLSEPLDRHQAGKPLTPAAMNHLIYGFVAKYRNATKPAYV